MNYKVTKDYPNYGIRENGEIFNINTNYVLKIKFDRCNQAIINLRKPGNRISDTVSIGRIIYATYNNVVLSKNDIIKFKDNNNRNFHYTNLININDNNKYINHIELDSTKKWKIIYNYPNYKISNYGDIFSIKQNKLLSPYKNNQGYHIASLIKNGIHCTPLVHRLVYMTFNNKNIPDDKVIDHQDRARDNNFIGNLKKVSFSENSINHKEYHPKLQKVLQYSINTIQLIKEWSSLKEIKEKLNYCQTRISKCCLGKTKHAYGFFWKYSCYIEDTSSFTEIITNDQHTYSNYKINKNGDIINRLNFLMVPQIKSYKYIKMLSDSDKKYHICSIHRLVALTFLKNEDPDNLIEVHHKDENKLNSHVDNLEWCTHQRNVVYTSGIKVNQIDRNTNEIIATFLSISDANRAMGKRIDSSIITFACKNSHQAYGYNWNYVK